jgi:hypothetical protein
MDGREFAIYLVGRHVNKSLDIPTSIETATFEELMCP